MTKGYDGRRDRLSLYVAAFLRAQATGMIAVVLGIYLSKLGYSAQSIGQVIGTGLAGAATAAALVTYLGYRLPNKCLLVLLACLSVAGGAAMAMTSGLVPALLAAFVGMLNGMGRDRGASLIVEQAVLPSTTTDEERTQTFAWYNLLQDAGHASGGLLAIAPIIIQHLLQIDEIIAYRFTIGLYVLLNVMSGLVYLCLSDHIEADRGDHRHKTSAKTRQAIWKISSLFALDGLGGGFLTTALLSLFFFARFHVNLATLGVLFCLARIANSLSHLCAAWLARRIGLLNTMVFTHLPSSIVLMAVPFAANFPVAAGLFLLRECLVQMDVPTRQSYVMAMVAPAERTYGAGVTHLVRLAAWAIAPAFAGQMMSDAGSMTPLMVGCSLKIAYDLLLFYAFRHMKPPEERMSQ